MYVYVWFSDMCKIFTSYDCMLYVMIWSCDFIFVNVETRSWKLILKLPSNHQAPCCELAVTPLDQRWASRPTNNFAPLLYFTKKSCYLCILGLWFRVNIFFELTPLKNMNVKKDHHPIFRDDRYTFIQSTNHLGIST